MIANGFHDKARKNAEFNIEHVGKAIEQDSIAVLSTINLFFHLAGGISSRARR